MNIKAQLPKLLEAARKVTTSGAPILATAVVSKRNYALNTESKATGSSTSTWDVGQKKHGAEVEEEMIWRPEPNTNPFKDQETGNLNLSDSGALGVSVDMGALNDTKKATEQWREEVKEYSDATKKTNVGAGFAETRNWSTTLKDSVSEFVAPYVAEVASLRKLAKDSEFVAPYAAEVASIGKIAKEKLNELSEMEQKLDKIQHQAAQDTQRQSEKINHAADFVTEKYAEVKDTISKSTPEWTAKAGEIVKEKAQEVYEKVAGTVHKAKDTLTTEPKKEDEHLASTTTDLHIEKEKDDSWSPTKPHEFELPDQKGL